MVGVVFDELLERAGAERSVAQDGERDKAKAERLADEVGSHFPPGQGGFGEIPQRLFPAHRLVDGGNFLPLHV